MPQIGARQLRADLAAHLRRAAAGETVTITVGGDPVAALGPHGAIPSTSLQALVASGAVTTPRRVGPVRIPEDPLSALTTVRPDQLMRGLR